MSKYSSKLNAIPAAGAGNGTHSYIFHLGCLGAEAGIDRDQVIADIKENLPVGTRHVPDREIEEGVNSAYQHVLYGEKKPRETGPKVSPQLLDKLIKDGKGATAEDIKAQSPVPLISDVSKILPLFLEALCENEEQYFIGDDKEAGIPGQTILPRDAWLKRLGSQVTCPKWIPNALTGTSAPKKSGDGKTYRGDGCVAAHRFVLCEHDRLPLEDQLAFWMASPMPVAALVHSGSKSIHGLVRVDCLDAAEWDSEVKGKLFPQYLIPLGFDSACQNPSRLSRLPGHVRRDTGLVQELLYLAPQGKAVAS